MTQASINLEPNLPWLDSDEDRNFRKLALFLLLVFFAAGFILNSLTLPEIKRQNLVDVSPRLAKLILAKEKVTPPAIKEAPLPEVKKKEPEKKKKTVTKKKEPPKEKRQTAREVAKQSGLIALSDELADLRESFDLNVISDLPQQEAAKQEIKIASTGDLLTSAATQSSGGITDTLTRKIETSELATRKTTTVKSNIESEQKTRSKTASQSSSSAGKRSAEEIERVFQKNKGAIFAIYNRALRKNPALQGKVVVELTIAPNGSVISVKIVSSDLNDKPLERKLVLKIKKFKFASSNVSRITVSYPIDFLPS